MPLPYFFVNFRSSSSFGQLTRTDFEKLRSSPTLSLYRERIIKTNLCYFSFLGLMIVIFQL